MSAHRLCAAVIAAIGWAALTLQASLTIGAVLGQGRSLWAALWLFFGFFTVLTNMLVALAMTLVAAGRWPGGPRPSPSALTAAALAIAVVGLLYHLLLSGRVPPLSGADWIADRTMHYLVPLLTAAYWAAFVPKSSFRLVDPFVWLIYPVAYLAYALARGAVDGWYPYDFIDAGALGYRRTLLNAAAVSVVILTLGFAIVAGARLLAARRRAAAPAKPQP